MNPSTYATQLTSLARVCILACLAMGLFGCNDDVNIPDGAFDEKILDLSGSWVISSVRQNGADITDLMEFSRLELQLNFDSDGPSTYTIENDGIPFLITQSGDWSYDDNIYPTQMIFNAGGESRMATFISPPISGGNDFSISFALGCEDNTYSYYLTRQ